MLQVTVLRKEVDSDTLESYNRPGLPLMLQILAMEDQEDSHLGFEVEHSVHITKQMM